MPPNVKPLDPPPAKRSKGQQAPPEVHIALNIAPTPGVGGEMSYVVLQTPAPPVGSTSTAAPLCPEEVGSSSPLTPEPKLRMRKATYMLVLALAKCAETDNLLNTQEVLMLMDYEDPQPDGKYIDSLDELVDFRLKNAKDIYALEDLFLATLGGLDKGGARKLRQFIKYKILIPLGVYPPPESPEPSIQAIEPPDNFKRVHKWRTAIPGEDEIEVLEDEVGWMEDEIEEIHGNAKVDENEDEIENEDGGGEEDEDEVVPYALSEV